MKAAKSEHYGTPKQFVMILGQSPSFANADQYVAFVGTKSGELLDKWMRQLSIQNGTIVNASDYLNTKALKHANLKRIEDMFKARPIDKVIALGGYASRVLCKLDIDHYTLPHPSLRNRQHNNPEFIQHCLNGCLAYLYHKDEQHEVSIETTRS